MSDVVNVNCPPLRDWRTYSRPHPPKDTPTYEKIMWIEDRAEELLEMVEARYAEFLEKYDEFNEYGRHLYLDATREDSVHTQAWLAKVELLHKDQDKLRIQLAREYEEQEAQQKQKEALVERGREKLRQWVASGKNPDLLPKEDALEETEAPKEAVTLEEVPPRKAQQQEQRPVVPLPKPKRRRTIFLDELPPANVPFLEQSTPRKAAVFKKLLSKKDASTEEPFAVCHTREEESTPRKAAVFSRVMSRRAATSGNPMPKCGAMLEKPPARETTTSRRPPPKPIGTLKKFTSKVVSAVRKVVGPAQLNKRNDNMEVDNDVNVKPAVPEERMEMKISTNHIEAKAADKKEEGEEMDVEEEATDVITGDAQSGPVAGREVRSPPSVASSGWSTPDRLVIVDDPEELAKMAQTAKRVSPSSSVASSGWSTPDRLVIVDDPEELAKMVQTTRRVSRSSSVASSGWSTPDRLVIVDDPEELAKMVQTAKIDSRPPSVISSVRNSPVLRRMAAGSETYRNVGNVDMAKGDLHSPSGATNRSTAGGQLCTINEEVGEEGKKDADDSGSSSSLEDGEIRDDSSTGTSDHESSDSLPKKCQLRPSSRSHGHRADRHDSLPKKYQFRPSSRSHEHRADRHDSLPKKYQFRPRSRSHEHRADRHDSLPKKYQFGPSSRSHEHRADRHDSLPKKYQFRPRSRSHEHRADRHQNCRTGASSNSSHNAYDRALSYSSSWRSARRSTDTSKSSGFEGSRGLVLPSRQFYAELVDCLNEVQLSGASRSDRRPHSPPSAGKTDRQRDRYRDNSRRGDYTTWVERKVPKTKTSEPSDIYFRRGSKGNDSIHYK